MLLQLQAPEMVRVPLEELVLQIHLLKLGKSHDFLQCVLEPPPLKSVQGALSQLQSVGALSKEEQLTPLGMPCSVLNVATIICHKDTKASTSLHDPAMMAHTGCNNPRSPCCLLPASMILHAEPHGHS